MAEAEPVEAELIRRAIESRLVDVQISMPGIVDSYDAATQRATVIPALRRPIYTVDDDLDAEEIPPLVNVPVRFDRSSKFSTHYRLQKGDFVHLVFQTYSPAEWRATGQLATPGEIRPHGFHAVAYPGYYPDTSAGVDVDESIGVPGSHSSRLHFTSAGIEAGDDAVKLKAVAIAALIDTNFQALATALAAAPGGPITFTPTPVASANLKALEP
jgi:hypothetical protein